MVSDIEVFANYSETVLGIPRSKYFNAGILLMNLAEMRKMHIEEVFSSLMSIKTYSVAQDQDYLNVICYGRVHFLDLLWNKTPMPYSNPNKTPYIAHYKINFKPWKYDGVMYGDLFWKYAQRTPFFSELVNAKNNYSGTDRKRDNDQYNSLELLAKKETDEELAIRNENEINVEGCFYILGMESLTSEFTYGKRKLIKAEAN